MEGLDEGAEPQRKERTVSCYNCTGANTMMMCGFPEFGCALCKTHGLGFGKLFASYRDKTVIIDGQTYIPPSYSCLFCKDKKVTKRTIWDNRLTDDSWSDHGEHAMPRVVLPCSECLPDEFKEQYERTKKEIL